MHLPAKLVSEADARSQVDKTIIHFFEPCASPCKVHLGNEYPAIRANRYNLRVVTVTRCALNSSREEHYRAHLRRGVTLEMQYAAPCKARMQYLRPPIAPSVRWSRNIIFRVGIVNFCVTTRWYGPLSNMCGEHYLVVAGLTRSGSYQSSTAA